MTNISIARDFSPSPGWRDATSGPRLGEANSGAAFRDEILAPALARAERRGDLVTVSLDGVHAAMPGFWNEAFGGLVRECGYSPARLRKLLRVVSDNPIHNPFYLNRIWRHVDQAGAGRAGAAE